MKKMITLLLVVVVLVTCMATTVSAAKAGQEVTVEFVSSGNPGFGSYNAVIEYDATALELVGINEGALTANKGMFKANIDTKKVGFASFNEVTGDGVLFTATFKVLDAAEMGKTYPVTAALIEGSASSITGADVAFTIVAASVEVDECEHKWSDWTETKPASCTEPGEESRTCSVCGKVETRPSALAAHKYEWKYDENYHWQECSVCHATTEKTAHTFDSNGNCICGAKKLDDQPDTGDYATPVLTFAVVTAIGMLAAAAYVTKRKFVK